MIGSGRDAIAKPEQLAAAEKVRCARFRHLFCSSVLLLCVPRLLVSFRCRASTQSTQPE